eukprot:Nitzschia sp. Nitz4//scaffold205_size38804//34191//35743//NITZ4_007651-RA/size38804-augustus-gene-0.56-mRNA-1//1//CDS//3329541534//7256//frame0
MNSDRNGSDPQTDSHFEWTNDLLSHVFSFFILNSDDGTLVDSQSLRSVMLVCKQWGAVANASSLWPSTASSRLPFGRALVMRDTVSNVSPCLVGLRKLRKLDISPNEPSNYYLVEERSQKRQCILSIGSVKHRTPTRMNHMYESQYYGPFRTILGAGTPEEVALPEYSEGFLIAKNSLVHYYQCTDVSVFAQPTTPTFCPARRWERRNLSSSDIKMSTSKTMRYLLLLEDQYMNLLPRTNSEASNLISLEKWASLVDWAFEISQVFDIEERVIYQAMGYFHHFFKYLGQNLRQSHYQLVVSACMLIASKCNLAPLKETDLVFCCDNQYTLQSIKDTEELVLKTMEWNVGSVTMVEFMHAFQLHWDIPIGKEFCLMRHLSDLTLQAKVALIGYKDSIIAAGVTVISRYTLEEGRVLWDSVLEEQTGYSLDEVCRCAESISRSWVQMLRTTPELESIARQFRAFSLTTGLEEFSPTVVTASSLKAYQSTVAHI